MGSWEEPGRNRQRLIHNQNKRRNYSTVKGDGWAAKVVTMKSFSGSDNRYRGREPLWSLTTVTHDPSNTQEHGYSHSTLASVWVQSNSLSTMDELFVTTCDKNHFSKCPIYSPVSPQILFLSLLIILTIDILEIAVICLFVDFFVYLRISFMGASVLFITGPKVGH